ncbi:MAG TPA: DUF6788 family protein [Vicinamibacteria bacterium]|nr:DUF6788 family protein [Vicinamibacteria bacterium]
MASTPDPATLRRQVERLLARQRALVKELRALREQVPGSVFDRYGTCGKEGCACRRGPGHGPYPVLSSRTAGRGAFLYLTRGQAQKARRLVAAARSYRQGMNRLKTLNGELLDLMRRYQRAVARAAGRRMGVQAA